jgi:DNA-binding response OmpR family regulator
MAGDELTILAVDDDPDYRDLYSVWLDERYDVTVAADGSAGLEALTSDTDIVVLDWEMPGLSGMAVAQEINGGSHDPYVAMVSSREPEFDIVDAPIDEFVRKPVDRDDLVGLVEQFRTQDAYHAALDDLFSLTRRLASLEAAHDEAELASHEEYDRLTRRIDTKRAEVDEAIAATETDWAVAFKTVGGTDEQRVRSPNA